MSISELENWNPMADDYSCPKFNTYNDMNSSHLYDMTGLYVRNVPADLTEEAFLSLMTEGGRKIKRHHLYPPKLNAAHTCGLVSFTTEEYARTAMQSLNRKPPLNFMITYANKKNDNRSTLRDNNATPAAVESKFHNNFHKTEKGQAHQANKDFTPNLKIVLDGGRRTTFHKSPVSSDQKQDKLQLPALVSNPFISCLFCDKVSKLSCEICLQPYCSQKCQEEDWPKHKALCLPFDKDRGNKGSIPSQPKRNLGNDSSYNSESDNDKNCESTFHPSTNIPSRKLPNHEPKKLTVLNANEIEETLLPQKPSVKVHVTNVKNPSCFWVQLESASSVLSEMEKEMSASVQKTAVPCTVNNVCCVSHTGKLKRVKILETKSGTSLVHFIDYGDSSTFQNDQLFHLPQVFKKYPAQAICCNLVESSKNRNIQWNEEESSVFRCLALNNTYNAYVHGKSNKVYDINLFNEDGVSVFTMVSLSNLQPDVQDSTPKCLEIPSVWTNLKQGMEISLVAVEFEDDKFWGVLDDSTDVVETIADVEGLLVNVNSPDISISCEEGDVAVGFSPEYHCNYRCIVLKRLRSSFLVRYIDYGNKEEVTTLRSLPSNLLQKKSFVVCCTKPASLSPEEFEKFKCKASGRVKTVNSSCADLSFQEIGVTLKCYPWHHGIVSESLSKQSVNSKNSSIPSNVPIKPPTKILKDAIADKNVHHGDRYDVRIVWIESSVMYVQLTSEEKELSSFLQKLNEYCNSKTCVNKHIPVKDEIVCCKFSDGCWYRGQVLAKSPNRFKVLFIDFGNEGVVSDKDIMPLPEKFTCPKFCIPVSLFDIKHKDITDILLKKLETEPWTILVKNNDTSPVQVMFFQGKKSLIDFIKRNKSSLTFQKLPVGQSVDVEICYAGNNRVYLHQLKDKKCIEDLIVKINEVEKLDVSTVLLNNVYCGLCKDGLWYRVCVDKELSPNTYMVTYIDYGNKEEVSSKDLKELPDELLSYPVFCVPVIATNFDATLFVENKAYPVEVTGEKNNVQEVKFCDLTPKHPVSSFQKLKLDNDKNEITLCYFENDTYYCHLNSYSSQLETMSKKLETCIKKKTTSDVLAVGDVYCVKSSDGCWYRASIEIINQRDSTYKVLFIDYGNAEIVALDDIMLLPDEFQNFPIFSIPVKVQNPEVLQEQVDAELTTFMVKAVDIVKNVQIVEFLKSKSAVELPTLPSQTVPHILPKENDESKPCDNVLLVESEKYNETSSELPSNEKLDSSLKFFIKDFKHVPFPPGEQQVIIYYIAENCHVFCAPFDTENIANNFKLTSEITEFCNNLDCSQFNGKSSPEQGEMVLAKYEEDKQWYRAVVTDKAPPFYDVVFVDFGNSETLHEDSLRRMEQQFVSLDMQAHLCLLTGFTVDEEKMPAVIEELQHFTSSPLTAVVGVLEEDITLCIPSITDHLIKKKLVTCV